MRDVIVTANGSTVQGVTVGKREKTDETAVMFTVDGVDVIEWYANTEIENV